MSKMKRRDFLKLAAVGTCGAAIHNVVSPLGGMMAFAQSGGVNNGRFMIIVNLAGGASYNIAPPLIGAYVDKMPTTSNVDTALQLTAQQGLHPSLTALKAAYDDGDLALINLAGHMGENRSHDESTQIWMRAIINASPSNSSGWLARLSCQIGGFLTAVSLGGSELIIQNSCNPGKAIGNLSSFGENSFWGGSYSTQFFRDIRENVISQSATSSHPGNLLVTSSMLNFQALQAQVQSQTNITLPVTFPSTSFGNQARDAAKLLAAPSLGVKLIFLQLGGFDTHSNEQSALTSRLNELNGGLQALADCLKALNLWDKASIITMSEFSRTFENGSQGTDHGHAAPMFVMGGNVNGGIKTPTPTATQINQAGQWFKDSQIHVDFRRAFLESVGWMGYSTGSVFPEPLTNTQYSNLGLFA